MNLIDKLINGEIALDVENSYEEDIKELSDIVFRLNPNLSQRFSPTYYFPTLESFCNHAKNQVCFYNVESVTWDGYRYFENSRFKASNYYNAKQILNDWFVEIIDKIENIDEEDFMKMFDT